MVFGLTHFHYRCMACPSYKKENPLKFSGLILDLAEREGFEPPVPLGTVVFKTTVIDHSTISPCSGMTRRVVLKASAKVAVFFESRKFFNDFLLQMIQNSNFAA